MVVQENYQMIITLRALLGVFVLPFGRRAPEIKPIALINLSVCFNFIAAWTGTTFHSMTETGRERESEMV